MKAIYARLFADAAGASRIEDLSIDLLPGFAVPPAEPLQSASFLAPEGSTVWIGAPPNWKGGEPHPAPRRMIFVTTQGEYEVTTSSGSIRRFPVRSVLLVEDVSGDGHSTRITSGESLIVFAVGLPKEDY